MQFGLVPEDQWVQPEWIDEEKASKAREEMARMRKGYQPIPYAKSVSYRNMCRFNSGVRLFTSIISTGAILLTSFISSFSSGMSY